MGVYSAFPFFLGIFLLLVFAASPIFKLADTPPHPSPNRISTLDGLRGFLALSVFFYHAVIYHEYVSTGIWAVPPSRFYTRLGPFGVEIFFMITGFLFWSIMIKNAGRPRWLELYAGRLFRIGPLYLFAILAALITIFSRTGFILHVSTFDFLKSLATLGALGILSIPSINGYNNTWIVLAGVTWSLAYEWYFYISLAIIGQAARHKITDFLLPVLLLPIPLFLMFPQSHMPPLYFQGAICAALFCIGMICASLRAKKFPVILPGWLSSIAVVILLAVTFVFVPAYSAILPILLYGAAFFFIAFGCDLFGLLSTLPARRLGNASFGIYLLQGLVLTWIFSIRPVKQFALESSYQYWIIIFLCAALLTLFAAATHFYIEQPGIKLGQSAIKTVRRWTQRKPQTGLASQGGV